MERLSPTYAYVLTRHGHRPRSDTPRFCEHLQYMHALLNAVIEGRDHATGEDMPSAVDTLYPYLNYTEWADIVAHAWDVREAWTQACFTRSGRCKRTRFQHLPDGAYGKVPISLARFEETLYAILTWAHGDNHNQLLDERYDFFTTDVPEKSLCDEHTRLHPYCCKTLDERLQAVPRDLRRHFIDWMKSPPRARYTPPAQKAQSWSDGSVRLELMDHGLTQQEYAQQLSCWMRQLPQSVLEEYVVEPPQTPASHTQSKTTREQLKRPTTYLKQGTLF